MYYPVSGIMHIKESLLLIGKSSLCGSSGFPLLQSEWSFTICVTPYNREARCSSVVRAFIHGAMGHWIDPSWGKSRPCGGSGFPLAL